MNPFHFLRVFSIIGFLTMGRRPTRPTGNPFNLLRSFSILSFVCIAVITLVTAVLLTRFLTANMLHRDAVVTMQFVQTIIETMEPSTYFVDKPEQENNSSYAYWFTNKDTPQVTTAFEDFFQRIALMPEVVRANVYAHDQTILWSNNIHLVGQHFPYNPELQRALAGSLTVKASAVQQHRKAEHVEFGPEVRFFAESYIPIWNQTHDSVLGVVEVYKTPDALFQAIAFGRRLVWTSAVGGGLFLYGVLFWIVRRAAMVIRSQEEKLIEAETLSAVGEMASAVAHNIRNPLASIRSSAEIVAEELAAEKRHAAQELVEDVITRVDHLEGWLRELLTYARPLRPTLETVQILEVIKRTLERIENVFGQQEVDVVLDVQESLPPLPADPHLLQQVLYSLMLNAFEAMPHNGTLMLQVTLTADGRYIQIQICDTGHGIPSGKIDTVFRPFFTTKRQGLGVGLPFAKRVIERHNGTITLSSPEGGGTTVIVRLPTME
jgi:signal transduction histidine kinase